MSLISAPAGQGPSKSSQGLNLCKSFPKLLSVYYRQGKWHYLQQERKLPVSKSQHCHAFQSSDPQQAVTMASIPTAGTTFTPCHFRITKARLMVNVDCKDTENEGSVLPSVCLGLFLRDDLQQQGRWAQSLRARLLTGISSTHAVLGAKDWCQFVFRLDKNDYYTHLTVNAKHYGKNRLNFSRWVWQDQSSRHFFV